MALKYSTCLRNKQQGGNVTRHVATITSTGIAAVDGGAGVDTLTIASGFLAAGFSPGDSILVIGFTGGAAGLVGPFLVSAVTDTTISVPTGSLADDAATESVTIVALVGGSIKDVFKDGVLKIYNGTQPTSPNDGLGGATCLVEITKASATFTSGAVAAGLEFGPAALGVVSKIANPADVWSGVNIASGTASWFRFYANATDAGGEDTTYIYPRIDGSVKTSGGELNMSSVSLVAAATTTIDTFAITLPESA
jgi:hypothetical protein